MKILVDIDECYKIGITPIEYVYLSCLVNNLSTTFDVDTLKELNFIDEDCKLTNDGKKVIVPDVSDAMMLFVKTYNAYPHKIDSRVLKSISIDSADGKHCLNKFKHYLKSNPKVGERMYKGLLVETKLKKNSGKELYYQDIRTWFNQMSWDKYADIDIDTTIIEKVERI
jgi:hypothetical protein